MGLSFRGLTQHTQSPPRLQKMSACHPHIAQHKQRYQLCRVPSQSLVADLSETELTLDLPERMLYLGRHAGFELLGREEAFICEACAFREPRRLHSLVNMFTLSSRVFKSSVIELAGKKLWYLWPIRIPE
jgi:hypothetical protein